MGILECIDMLVDTLYLEVEALSFILKREDIQSMEAPADGLEVSEEIVGFDYIIEGIRVA